MEKKTFKPEFGQQVKDAFAFKAEQDVRKATLPKAPENYELKMPATFKPPEGQTFELDQSNPVLAQARQLAHARGMDQDTFSDFLGLVASDKIAEATKINNARNAELGKLGSAAPQRIDAVKTWAHAKLGPDLGGAIEQMLVSSKHVEAFEGIINQFSRQGGTQFSQAHREGEPPSGEIPGYDQMSFTQRRAAQMNQKAAGGR